MSNSCLFSLWLAYILFLNNSIVRIIIARNNIPTALLIIIWKLWLVRIEEGYSRRWSGLQMRFTLIFLVTRRCSTFPRFPFSGQHHLWYHHNALVGRQYHSLKIGFDHSLRMQQHWKLSSSFLMLWPVQIMGKKRSVIMSKYIFILRLNV